MLAFPGSQVESSAADHLPRRRRAGGLGIEVLMVAVAAGADGGLGVSTVAEATWDSGYPNGESCPACWFGELEVVFE